jgi:DNA invertase Pin-like site-specific DNA recombinase
LVDHPRLELRSRLQWRPDMPNEDFGRRRGENLQRAPRIGDGTWQHVETITSQALRKPLVRAVGAKGASLKATEQPIDTSTTAGKAFLDMLGVFAEFETNLRRERQLEGIARAKAAGVYKGRPATIDAAQVRELKASGKGPSEIAKTLGIGRASVYRALGPAS